MKNHKSQKSNESVATKLALKAEKLRVLTPGELTSVIGGMAACNSTR
jgi:hypothetical protein